MQPHRDSQKRIYSKGATYFITSNTYERFEYFTEPILAELFVRDLWYAVELKRFKLHGYTVLPDHIHLLITPKSVATYSDVMQNIKRVFSLQANQIMFSVPSLEEAESEDIYPRFLSSVSPTQPSDVASRSSDDPYSTLQWTTMLKRMQKRFFEKHGLQHDFPKFRWQKSFRDHVIRGRPDFKNHIDYIHKNALKHGLVKVADDYDWMWVEGMREPVFD